VVYREPSTGHVAKLDALREEIELAEARFNDTFWSYLREADAPGDFARIGLPADGPVRLLAACGVVFADLALANEHLLLLDAVTNAIGALERLREETPEEIPAPSIPGRRDNALPFDPGELVRFATARDPDASVERAPAEIEVRFVFARAPIVAVANGAHLALRTAVSRGHGPLVVRERTWLEGLLVRGVGPFGDDALDALLWMEGAKDTAPLFQRIEVVNALTLLVRCSIPRIEILAGHATLACEYEPTAAVVDAASRVLAGLRGESTVSFTRD
jgi:hypothetical protein